MKNPLLSVCIPTFNRSLILKRTIENLIKFDSDDFEIVVSDNGSDDDTKDVVTSIIDSRIRYFNNENNKGGVFNMVKVLDLAIGDYCLLLSDEDDAEVNNVLKVLRSIKYTDPLVIKGNHFNYFGKKVGENFKKFAFKFGYMSGIVFKRDSIDFLDLKVELNKLGNGYIQFHPHIYLTNQLMNKGPVLSTNIEFFRLRDRGEDYMETINNYRCDDLISWFDQTRTNLNYIISNPNLDETTKISLSLALYRGFLYYVNVEPKQIPLDHYNTEDYRYKLKIQIKQIINNYFPSRKFIVFRLYFSESIVIIKTNFPKCYSLINKTRIQFFTLILDLLRNINLKS
jgi:glycosyltransferase involved in cell wall biosynthesis